MKANVACTCDKKRGEPASRLRNGSDNRDCHRHHPQPICICDACWEAKHPGSIKEATS